MKHFLIMISLVLCLTGCTDSGDTVSCYAETSDLDPSVTVIAEAPDPTATELPDPAVLMTQCEEPFSLSFPRAPVPDGISAFIHNASGQEAQVLLIPTLERKSGDDRWESVPFRAKIGFCGTPDPLPCEGIEWNIDLQLLYGTLPSGSYRLSCTITDADGTEHTASSTFQIGSYLCSYPTADYFG